MVILNKKEKTVENTHITVNGIDPKVWKMFKEKASKDKVTCSNLFDDFLTYILLTSGQEKEQNFKSKTVHLTKVNKKSWKNYKKFLSSRHFSLGTLNIHLKYYLTKG